MRIVVLAWALVLGGCPHSDDPQLDADPGVLDADILLDGRILDAAADAHSDGGGWPGIDFSGRFLVAIRAGFESGNDPSLYLQFLVDWNVNTGTSRLIGAYVPLCTAGQCESRFVLPPAIIDQFSPLVFQPPSFEQWVIGTLPGLANPFTGVDVSLDARLEAQIRSADLVCGGVRGMIEGTGLQGSTFAAQRVKDIAPSALPPPLAACP